ncbi:dihydrolipoamide dehydrogenase [Arboricoccus pini]|uniref:Dihydrolipoyl dehydrogenase n=1 Tax=Arboricoccus pini TaxID=1963835 RepID=A0A212RTL7_9PROT|nr:dihydrolipoyl dehydrogenase [Arboricoccus pini]SNB75945.1 dihydrolipoamide dehydrogenase [Arboricoccus pini]
MSNETYDLVVIGGGPGGYVAAIKAAQLGLRVACVEKRGRLGGTCLNIGCIPSKSLLHASHLYEDATSHVAEWGVLVEGVKLDLARMQSAKSKVVIGLTDGIEFLFKKNKVDYVRGAGKLRSPTEVEVALADGGQSVLSTRNILIATGSESAPLPGVEIDEKRVVSSTGALELESVPKRLIVIGGGYIGLEMGTVWRRLGAEVTVIEFLDRITPGMDGEVSKQFQRILAKQGMSFRLGTKVMGVDSSGPTLKVAVEAAKGGEAETLEADVVLVSIGRRPYTEALGLEALGVKLDERGRIEVGEDFKSSVPGIFAIGDVIKGPMLAHKAEEEGSCVAEFLAGQKPHIDYDIIPGVVYTVPEVASIGKTEEQLKEAGIAYKTGKFPFLANSRARATGNTEGFVKILADATTDRVLGAHIIGADAGTLIAEIAMAMEFGASSEDIARTCHAHPTLEEAVKEAALATFFKPIHS